MRSGFLVALLAVLGLGVAGCGGAGHTALPGTPSGASAAQKQRVTFAIDVPKQTGAGNRQRPQYVSPATTQLAIAITEGGTPVAGYPVTVPLTPTSGGCTSTLASTECQLTISLGAGSYVATLTAEDAGGTALSSAQSVAFTVVAGTNNTVSLVLSGVPASITAQPLPGSTDQLVLNAFDADQNLIVGPGAPTFTVSETSGIALTITQPTTTAPNVATIVPGASGTAALTVAAAYSGSGETNACTLSGAVCSANVTLTSSLPVFVGSLEGDSVVEHQAPYATGPTVSFGNVGSGIEGLAADGAGDVFVSTTTSVAEYAPPYTVPATVTLPPGGGAITLGPGGALFVGGDFNVYEYTPPYTGTPVTTQTVEPGATQLGLAVSADGELAVPKTEQLYVFAPPYTGTPTTVTTDIVGAAAVAFDASDDLIVVNSVPGTVDVYPPPYTGTPTAVAGVNGPIGIALDASGDLFVANNNNNTVTEYTPPYTGAAVATISTDLSGPFPLAIDRLGDLFVGNYTNATIAEFAPPYTGTPTVFPAGVSEPRELAVGSGFVLTISP
ncbi:MAG: hypothetical protein ABR975_01690 [Vulcanimicrobiaceae bacterium]